VNLKTHPDYCANQRERGVVRLLSPHTTRQAIVQRIERARGTRKGESRCWKDKQDGKRVLMKDPNKEEAKFAFIFLSCSLV
jgi:hypothetical protein